MSIKKIAEKVGVSISTVSRVLNNPDYHTSSEEIRQKIWRAAIEMNYRPNKAAQNLKSGKGHTDKTYYINILFTRTDTTIVDPFFEELIRVVESEIHRESCILSKLWTNAAFSEGTVQGMEKLVEKLWQETDGKADGLVIVGKCSSEAVECWKKHYRSVVVVSRNPIGHGVDEVVCDGHKIASMATEHLIKLGHQRIAYVGDCNGEARYQGFLNTLEGKGLSAEERYVISSSQSEAEGYEIMERLAQSKEPPTGIYCASDITAVGMLGYLSRIPGRFYQPSIIASDGIEEGEKTKPMLTTVRISKEDMGRHAMYLLLDRLKGRHREVARIEIEPVLLERGSCFPVEGAKEL